MLYFLHNLSKRSRDTQCTLWLFSFSRSHLMQFLLEICRGLGIDTGFEFYGGDSAVTDIVCEFVVISY